MDGEDCYECSGYPLCTEHLALRQRDIDRDNACCFCGAPGADSLCDEHRAELVRWELIKSRIRDNVHDG